MKEIKPELGEIVAGLLTGDVPDAKKALTKFKDSLSAERERAVTKVAKAGAKVSLDDWSFPNWERGTDYGLDSYS